MKDRIIEAIREDLLRRSELGIKKYGTTLEREDYEVKDWINHMYEELLDAIGYLKALENRLNDKKVIKFMSDTHGYHYQEPLEEVDILIHSGDGTNSHDLEENKKEWEDFWNWFCDYPAKYKIYVPGNHDVYLEKNIELVKIPENTYILINQCINIMGFNIFGSPFTSFSQRWAFNKSIDVISKIWGVIPYDVDILITHVPPRYVLDGVFENGFVIHAGDDFLKREVIKRKPIIHCFGHIHDNEYVLNYGVLDRNNTKYINASQVRDHRINEGLVNKSIVLSI